MTYFLSDVPDASASPDGVLVPESPTLPPGGASALSRAAIAAAVSRLDRMRSFDRALPDAGNPAADGGGTDAVGANGL